MEKLNRGSDNTMDAETTEKIVGTPFPEQLIQEHPVQRIPRGLDGIPVKVLKLAVNVIPGILLDMFNVCLVAGIFPRVWKVDRLLQGEHLNLHNLTDYCLC